ncbi:lariat debranching enzyme, C-terminal domain-containing protein [Aspergillus keveii]|uniref:Lariat debranching enzyme, C-terminal domain-containing protein n=1 Tax=Aspergillus keveii TaxID=714993 RepID=A0ABR4GLH5_9EURO
MGATGIAMSDSNSQSFRVAVEGCGHGRLHDIYASVEHAATLKGWGGVDLLIIGGDFQAIRNSNDLACMSVPLRYREIGDFHEYYSGQRTAPYLTIFIGGNHEASNYMFELYYGGWVAPNIYYMGAANVLRCGPLRIAALSGIFKGYNYRTSHYERLPYNEEEIKSIYHVRELDVRKLLQVRTQVDVGLSHDWPHKIEYCGDWNQLFQKKRGFREDSENGKLGSQAARYVLDRLRPAYWFSAHLHVKFAACLQHTIPEIEHHFGLDGAGASLTALSGKVFDILAGEEEQQQTAPQEEESRRQSVPDRDTSQPILPQPANEDAPILNMQSEAAAAPSQNTVENVPDRLAAWQNFGDVAAKNEAAENDRFFAEQGRNPPSPTPDVKHNLTWRKVDSDEDGVGRKVASVERNGAPREKKQKTKHHDQVMNADEIDLGLDSDSDLDAEPLTAKRPMAESTNNPKPSTQSDVSEDLRKQLPSSFAAPPPPQPRPVPVQAPFPAAIKNTTTNFLALDKCGPRDEFLQLLEIDPVSEATNAQVERPFRLQYDKEWLAITRVFAADLQLGNHSARPPSDRGGAVYRPLIEREEAWVEENIVKAGKLDVPENFVITAPIYNPAVPITVEEQSREYTNPQTAAFCDLINIRNKFHLSEEERDARIAAGPRPCDNLGWNRPRRGGYGGRGRDGGGRGRGRGYGRGGYGSRGRNY